MNCVDLKDVEIENPSYLKLPSCIRDNLLLDSETVQFLIKKIAFITKYHSALKQLKRVEIKHRNSLQCIQICTSTFNSQPIVDVTRNRNKNYTIFFFKKRFTRIVSLTNISKVC